MVCLLSPVSLACFSTAAGGPSVLGREGPRSPAALPPAIRPEADGNPQTAGTRGAERRREKVVKRKRKGGGSAGEKKLKSCRVEPLPGRRSVCEVGTEREANARARTDDNREDKPQKSFYSVCSRRINHRRRELWGCEMCCVNQ